MPPSKVSDRPALFAAHCWKVIRCCGGPNVGGAPLASWVHEAANVPPAGQGSSKGIPAAVNSGTRASVESSSGIAKKISVESDSAATTRCAASTGFGAVCVGVAVRVAVGVGVRVQLAVGDALGVDVAVGVDDAAGGAVAVSAGVAPGVAVRVGVDVAALVLLAVPAAVAVCAGDAVCEGDAGAVDATGVGVGDGDEAAVGIEVAGIEGVALGGAASVGVGEGGSVGFGGEEGVGVAVGASVANGSGVGVIDGCGGQPSKAALTAWRISSTLTAPSPSRSNDGHRSAPDPPRANATPRRISSTVTAPSPSQSPGQGAAGGVATTGRAARIATRTTRRSHRGTNMRRSVPTSRWNYQCDLGYAAAAMGIDRDTAAEHGTRERRCAEAHPHAYPSSMPKSQRRSHRKIVPSAADCAICGTCSSGFSVASH